MAKINKRTIVLLVVVSILGAALIIALGIGSYLHGFQFLMDCRYPDCQQPKPNVSTAAQLETAFCARQGKVWDESVHGCVPPPSTNSLLRIIVTVESGNFGPLLSCISGVTVFIGDQQFLLPANGGVASTPVKKGADIYVSASAYHQYAEADKASGATGQTVTSTNFKIFISDGAVEMKIPLRPEIRFADEGARQADCKK